MIYSYSLSLIYWWLYNCPFDDSICSVPWMSVLIQKSVFCPNASFIFREQTLPLFWLSTLRILICMIIIYRIWFIPSINWWITVSDMTNKNYRPLIWNANWISLKKVFFSIMQRVGIRFKYYWLTLFFPKWTNLSTA